MARRQSMHYNKYMHGRPYHLVRLFAGIGVLACFFVAPWWLVVVCSVLYLLAYHGPVEAVIMGLLLDSVYAFDAVWGGVPGFVFTGIFVALVVVFWWLRGHVWSSARTM